MFGMTDEGHLNPALCNATGAADLRVMTLIRAFPEDGAPPYRGPLAAAFAAVVSPVH